MKLARKTQDGDHGEHHLYAKAFRQTPGCKQSLILRVIPDRLRDTAKSVKNTKDDEQPYRHKSQ